MVVIRLSRSGRKGHPFYHIVVADSRKKCQGKFIEVLGFYNPVANKNEESLRICKERAVYWIENGAKPSETVSKLIKL